MEILTKYWFELIFGLISAAALAFCKYLHKKVKDYEKLSKEKDHSSIVKLVDERIKPLQDAIHDRDKEMEFLKDYFKTLLIHLCEGYLERGSMTAEEFSSLTDIYKIYHEGLKGNHQGTDFYEKAKLLPIRENHHKNKDDE